jgi:hypothetical protein
VLAAALDWPPRARISRTNLVVQVLQPPLGHEVALQLPGAVSRGEAARAEASTWQTSSWLRRVKQKAGLGLVLLRTRQGDMLAQGARDGCAQNGRQESACA